MDGDGGGRWPAPGGVRRRIGDSGGFTLLEVVIASVILALLVAVFASALSYQALQRSQVAERDLGYEVMEENLSSSIDQNSVTSALAPQSQPITINRNTVSGFTYYSVNDSSITNEQSFSVAVNGKSYYYNLLEISPSLMLTSHISNQPVTVTGSTLVATQNIAP